MIGIGAGPPTDGQVLVFHDLLGHLHGPHSPRFVKRYAEIHDEMVEGVRAYADEVRAAPLPGRRARLLDRPRRARGAEALPRQESLAAAAWDW